MDDDRRYWNPGALFAERAVEYWRRPHKSRFVAVTALVLAVSCVSFAIVGLVATALTVF